MAAQAEDVPRSILPSAFLIDTSLPTSDFAIVPRRVLIVPDKFKGTLTARAAAEAIALGWRQAQPNDRLELLPMSDGGDGFGEVMSSLLQAIPQKVKSCDAAHRPCTVQWWWDPRSRTGIIETARVVGLAMLPDRRYHPFDLDTYGLGEVVLAAIGRGARRLLVGLGGSATNDAGFGMARALGWEFQDAKGRVIERWTDLDSARVARRPKAAYEIPKVVVAVDVQNRLLGSSGATQVYGPQKGLRPADFPLAERCLRRLAKLVTGSSRADLSRAPGAGAAGGLGFGFAAFLKGRLTPGFDLFAREVGLDRRLRLADLVITGEGKIDRSTLMGKGAGQIARRAQELGLPFIGLAGVIALAAASRNVFTQMHALTDLTSVHKAKAQPRLWLERLASRVASNWSAIGPKSAAEPGNSKRGAV